MFGLYDMMGNVYELTCEYVPNYNTLAMSYDLEILREAAGDDTLGKSPENPIVDYKGRAEDGSCWRTMGGGYGSSQLTIWNAGWHMHQLYSGNVYPSVGVRVSMNVE